jgi:hypothetical protein
MIIQGSCRSPLKWTASTGKDNTRLTRKRDQNNNPTKKITQTEIPYC